MAMSVCSFVCLSPAAAIDGVTDVSCREKLHFREIYACSGRLHSWRVGLCRRTKSICFIPHMYSSQ